MKKILCDDKTCIHNEDVNINNDIVLMCLRNDDIKVNDYRNTCDGYEKIEDYLKRIDE